jgi:prickle
MSSLAPTHTPLLGVQEERGKEGAEQRLFCGRDWANNRRPRCGACDETIHEGTHVFELGAAWHFRHFACYICDANLTAKMTYVPRDGK